MNHVPFDLPTLSVDLVGAAQRSRGPLSHLSTSALRQLEQRYRMYLRLKSKHFESIFAPTDVIDEMWHLHMLHPRAYASDCMAIFGTILDHNPGFGTAENELPSLLNEFENTRQLWEAEFSIPYVDADIAAGELPHEASHIPRGVVMCIDKEGSKPKPKPKPKPNPKPRLTQPPFGAVAH